VDTENKTSDPLDPYNDALAALIRGRKAELGLTYQDIEAATGINLRTAKRLFDGQRPIKFGNFLLLCAAPVSFTDEQYMAAAFVRSNIGWHKVVRVNAKSVTVATAYSWTDRIQRAKILEVRSDK